MKNRAACSSTRRSSWRARSSRSLLALRGLACLMVDYSRWEGIADSDDDSDLDSEDDEAEAQILGPGFDDDDDDSSEVCPPCAPAAAPHNGTCARLASWSAMWGR